VLTPYVASVAEALARIRPHRRENGLIVTIVTCNNRNMLSRKQQLQAAALHYLLEHGIADLSLRPLAARLGTSPRMLMFHFTSKEGLLQDVLAELHARLQASFATIASADSAARDDAPLKRFWLWAASKKNLPYLRLLYELQIIAIQNPAEYGRYWKKISMDWQAMALKATSESLRSEPIATLCIAVFDGLFLELMSTGDRSRLTRALDHFISMARMAIHVQGVKRPHVRRAKKAVKSKSKIVRRPDH
jgi:AcrR family transcriptional regulator